MVDHLPSIVGRTAGVREGSVALGSYPVPGADIGRAVGNLVGAGLDLGNELASQNEEAAITATKRALVDANNELDSFMTEASGRVGQNADGVVADFERRAQEIRNKYGSQLTGKQLEVFNLQYDNAYGGMYKSVSSHRARELDRAAGEMNQTLTGQFRRRLELNSNDDAAFGNLLTVFDAEMDRRGIVDVKYRADQWRETVDEIQLGRINALMQSDNVAGAKVLLERFNPESKYEFALSPDAWKMAAGTVNKMDELDTIQRSADELMANARKVAAKGGNLAEIELATYDLARKQYKGKQEEEVVKALKTRFGEFEKFHKATGERLERESFGKLVQLGSYTKAAREQEKELIRLSPEEAEAKRNQLRKFYGYGSSDHPVTVRAMDAAAEAVANGSYVLNNMEWPIKNMQDFRDFWVRSADAPWSEEAYKFGEKLLKQRANSVPVAELNNIVESIYPKKKAMDFPGLRQFVQDAVPADRPASFQEIEQATKRFFAVRALNRNGMWFDTPTTLGEMGADEDVRLSSAQLERMMAAEIAERKANRRAIPAWMQGSERDQQTLDRYARGKGFVYKDQYYQRSTDQAALPGDAAPERPDQPVGALGVYQNFRTSRGLL